MNDYGDPEKHALEIVQDMIVISVGIAILFLVAFAVDACM